METTRKLSTKEKALKINLDQRVYGSFAEIGAGQEVAANFFKAGGASGTVAKTMSAYDMAFSDAIYGEAGRYVCEERLIRMLDKEYSLLGKRLKFREHNTCFFAFADTVETTNYQRTNKGHGWMGLRFQMNPEQEPNECVIHFLLNDSEANWQQRAIGIIGVNLMYASLYLIDSLDELVKSLLDGIVPGTIEIDMIRFTGKDVAHIDNRLLSLKLVKNGLSKAAMFGPDGQALQPSEALYKKNAMVLSGRFRPFTKVNEDMLEKALHLFKHDSEVDESSLLIITELTLNALIDTNGLIDDQDFLDRVDILCSLGHTVMITNFLDYYFLVPYINNLTRGKKVGYVLGIRNIERIFKPELYEEFHGGMLEAFSKMFGKNVKAFAYPHISDVSNQLVNLDNLEIDESRKALLQYLLDNDKLEDITNPDFALLNIHSDQVLKMIKQNQDGWENYVPNKVAKAIKANCLFDFPCEPYSVKTQ